MAREAESRCAGNTTRREPHTIVSGTYIGMWMLFEYLSLSICVLCPTETIIIAGVTEVEKDVRFSFLEVM